MEYPTNYLRNNYSAIYITHNHDVCPPVLFKFEDLFNLIKYIFNSIKTIFNVIKIVFIHMINIAYIIHINIWFILSILLGCWVVYTILSLQYENDKLQHKLKTSNEEIGDLKYKVSVLKRLNEENQVKKLNREKKNENNENNEKKINRERKLCREINRLKKALNKYD